MIEVDDVDFDALDCDEAMDVTIPHSWYNINFLKKKSVSQLDFFKTCNCGLPCLIS